MNKFTLLVAIALMASVPSLFAVGFTLKNVGKTPIKVTAEYTVSKPKTFMLQAGETHTDPISCAKDFYFTADPNGVSKRYFYTNVPSCLAGKYTLELNWNAANRELSIQKK